MEIISRAQWGARYASAYRNYDAPLPAPDVWLHHSVTIAPDVVPPFDDDYAAIRTIEQVGQNRFGWGISYTWLITPAGLIFQGHRVDGVGTHTANRNSSSRAICFVGNYEANVPTAEQLQATAWLLRHAKAQGWIEDAMLTGGHRDLKATACPGINAYRLIDDINALAAQPAGGAAAPATPRRFEEDTVELPTGKHAKSFQIPDGARRVAINCPHVAMTVNGLVFSGDRYPPGDAKDGVPNFDFKGDAAGGEPKTVDRLRPWRLDVPNGATNGAIYYDYPQPDNRYEYAGSLDFI